MMTVIGERLRMLVEEVEARDLPELSEELVRSVDLPVDRGEGMAIAEVAAVTGVSAHTLRYYERIGLLTVARDAGGRRRYDVHAVGRVMLVGRLRMGEMPVRDIAHYLDLVGQGEATVPARVHMLQAQRRVVRQRLDQLRDVLAVLDYKITAYGGSVSSDSPQSSSPYEPRGES
ncbi:MerR family transcriptional regulator [Sciscionella marina]|uniref:MerR family transcriptional regulator n=1 Tax=Sciscionella marina TaxID=508770 RepID=UPI0003A57F01|nr:MerR family transcriptional regulator [Sciscionella marina]